MASRSRLVLCVHNKGYEVALERRKIDETLSDASAKRGGLLRVIDESGDDYLYPEQLFVAIMLLAQVRRSIIAAA